MARDVVLDALRDKIDAEHRNIRYLDDCVKYLRKQAREAVRKYRRCKRLLAKSRGTFAALVKATEELP